MSNKQESAERHPLSFCKKKLKKIFKKLLTNIQKCVIINTERGKKEVNKND